MFSTSSLCCSKSACATESEERARAYNDAGRAADEALGRGDYKKTIQLCEQLHRQFPGLDLGAYVLECHAYRSLKQYSKAVERIQIAQRLCPTNTQVAMHAAWNYAAMKDRKKYLESLQNVLKTITPTSEPIFYSIFVTECHKEDLKELEQKALAVPRQNDLNRIRHIFCMPAKDRLKSMRSAVELMEKLSPSTPDREIDALCDSCENVCNWALLHDHISECETLANHAIQLRPNRGKLRVFLGICLIEQGNTTRGANEVARGLRDAPDLPTAFFAKPLVKVRPLLEEGKKDQAKKILRTLLASYANAALHPENVDPAQTYSSIGSNADEGLRTKDYDKALRACRQLHEKFPGREIGAYIIECVVYRQRKQFTKGLECIEAAKRVNPTDPQVLLEEAVTYMEMGQSEKSTRLLRAMLPTLGPDSEAMLGAYIGTCHDLGMKALELKALRKAVPDDIARINHIFCFPTEREQAMCLDMALLRAKKITKDSPFAEAFSASCLNICNWAWQHNRIGDCRLLATKAINLRPSIGILHAMYGLCLADEGACSQGNSEIALGLKLNPAFTSDNVADFAVSRIHNRLSHREKEAAIRLIECTKDYIRNSPKSMSTLTNLAWKYEFFDRLQAFGKFHTKEKLSQQIPLIRKYIAVNELARVEELLKIQTADLDRLTEALNIFALDQDGGTLFVGAGAFPIVLSISSRMEALSSSDHKNESAARTGQEKLRVAVSNMLYGTHRLLPSPRLQAFFIDPIEEALQNGPLPAFYLETLSLLYARCDDLDNATRVAAMCRTRFPTYEPGRKLQAVLLLRMGKTKEAAAAAKQIEKEFGIVYSMDDLRNGRRMFETKLAADILFRKLRSSQTGDTPEYLNRDIGYYLAKAKTTKQLDPQITAAGLAVCKQDYKFALKLLDQVLTVEPNNSRAHEVRSWALLALNRNDEAKNERRLARESSTTDDTKSGSSSDTPRVKLHKSTMY
ncbi:MAG: hypothetical protein K2X93_15740 [Candidatus Obscuribacterales bacterium]|nr:hypothetical protein [Candidatus Obscuribacterales bacterium]